MLHYRLHCSCLISVPSVHTSVHTSLFMFHCYFLCSRVHLIHFGYRSPSCSYLSYLVAFVLHGHWTALSVSLFGGSPPRGWRPAGFFGWGLDLWWVFIAWGWALVVLLLLGAGLRWFCWSLSVCVGRGVVVGGCLGLCWSEVAILGLVLLVTQLEYTKCISNNRALFYLWWK